MIAMQQQRIMMERMMRNDPNAHQQRGRMLGNRPPLPPLTYENMADEERQIQEEE